MPDEVIPNDTPQGESGAPDLGAGSPPAGGSPTPSGTATPLGDSQAGDTPQPLETSEQVVDPIEAALKELPSVDELKAEAERGVKYARALQDLRPIAEQARTQSQQFEPWKSVVDQYGEPTRLQTQLEVANEFLKDKVENGQTVPDTSGLPAYLDANSPARADSLLVDLLNSKVNYNEREDSRLNHLSRHLYGRSHEEVVAALKELETRPAVDKTELESIDPKFHGVWKNLASETREWLLNPDTSETARNDYLSRALSDEQRSASDKESADRATQERVARENAFAADARVEGEKAVVEGLGQILNSVLELTFKDISNDTVTLTGSKEDDVLVRLFIGGTLASLTDPAKAPYVANDLKALGITLDPEIFQHEATYEQATIAAKVAARYGDKASAAARQLEADRAAMWLKAKGNELSGAMISRLSKILGISNENGTRLLANANGGRQSIQGNPLSSSGGNNGQPVFTKPLGPERTAEIVNRFAR